MLLLSTLSRKNRQAYFVDIMGRNQVRVHVKFGLILFGLFICSSSAWARDNTTCDIVQGQPLTNAYGPWDYTNPKHKKQLPIVINAHFTKNVERLIKGENGSLESDIDYTLRAIPNYHPALHSMGKLHRKKNLKYKMRDTYWSADCYFKRAIYHQPGDPVTHMLYGIHLHLSKNYDNAEKLYYRALGLSPGNAEIHYNLGLLYVATNDLEKAEQHATKAYELGYQLPGLKNKLAKARSNAGVN